MADLYQILPEAMLYLSSGFAFVCGLYLLIDKRFDFFSEISFSMMLILGFLLNTAACAIPVDFGFRNLNLRNIVMVAFSFFCGMAAAAIRNKAGNRVSRFVIKVGRRKSASKSFWYDLLDEKDKPVWLRMTNLKEKYILDGVWLSLAETDENPYLLLGYCKKYTLTGEPMDFENICSKYGYVQKVVRPDSFDEVTLIYAEDSEKGIHLNISETAER